MTSVSRPIVVAFDGSPDSIRALHWALETATRIRARVRVVVVGMEPESVAAAVRQFEQGFVAGAAAQAVAVTDLFPDVHSDVVVRHGWTVPVLVEETSGADLLVLGSRGHGAVERFWLGSVSHHVTAHASCPVAVVRKLNDPTATRILVGVDGSPASAHALAFACERALLTGVEVVATYAYQAPLLNAPGLAVLPKDLDTRYVDAAERLVAELVAGVASDFPDVSLRSTAVVGRPAEVLARLSEDSALVVVGSRGHNAFAELLLGSVAQESLRRASCPVVVVR